MADPELRRIQRLIDDDDLEEARSQLASSQHPLAQSWLQQLNAQPEADAAGVPRRLVLEDGEIPSEYRRAMLRSNTTTQELSLGNTVALSGIQAVQRTARAVPAELLWTSIGGIFIVLLILMVAIPPVGFLLFLLLVVGTAAFLMAGDEVTTHNPINNVMTRQYLIGRLAPYTITADMASAYSFQGELPPDLMYPPSISALLLAPYQAPDSEGARTAAILKATLIALWAWNLIELRHVAVDHQPLGLDLYTANHMILMPAPGITSFDVDGDLERSIMAVLERWPNMNQWRVESWPWRPGPSVAELVAALRTDQVLGQVQRDAVGRGLAEQRGWIKSRFVIPRDAVKALRAEAHNVQVLAQNVMQQHPEIIGLINEGISRATGSVPVRYYQLTSGQDRQR